MVPSDHYLADLAIAEEEVGDLRSAKADALQALALSSERSVKLHAAFALARAGSIGEARQRAQELKSEVPNGALIMNYEPCIEAAIALSESRLDRAINVFGTSCPNNPAHPVRSMPFLDWRYLRGLVYLKQQKAEKAATAFQSIIDHPELQMWMGRFWEALAYLQLARAQVMMGDQDDARTSYQDFLTIWKDADPDIPICKQTKAEYAKLNKQRDTSHELRAKSSQPSAVKN